MEYDLAEFDVKLKGASEWLTREYQGLRTGRAAPTLLDAVQVNAYGSRVPLKQVASISVEDARTLRIAPYDAALVKEVEKAITSADLGVGLSVDEAGVRTVFPELTGERRGEFVKFAKQKLEEARTTVRVARDEVWNDVQKKERNGELTEDDKYTLKDELQKKIDATNASLEKLYEQKENEIVS